MRRGIAVFPRDYFRGVQPAIFAKAGSSGEQKRVGRRCRGYSS